MNSMGGHGWAHVMLWVGMGGHRWLLMVMVWVWVQIRKKMLGSAEYIVACSLVQIKKRRRGKGNGRWWMIKSFTHPSTEEDEKDSGGHIMNQMPWLRASLPPWQQQPNLSLSLSLSLLLPLDLPWLDSTATCRVRFRSPNSADHALHRPYTSPQSHVEDFSFLQQPSFDHFHHGLRYTRGSNLWRRG
jgi:hypothetical protein